MSDEEQGTPITARAANRLELQANRTMTAALADSRPPPELRAIAVLIRERDEALASLALRTGQLQASRRHVSEAEAEIHQAVGLAGDYAKERDFARAEQASARQELELLRAQAHWIVARYCERCEREVLRGESYGLEPGTDGLVHHIDCPDQPEGGTGG